MSKGDDNLEEKIDRVWCPRYWDEKAEEIEMAYWDAIKGKLPKGEPYSGEAEPTEHRIEAFVRRLAREKGLPNLHVGLTSSDIEDNVRASRLEDSNSLVQQYIFENVVGDASLLWIDKEHKTAAKTHLMPAGSTDFWHRFMPTIESITNICLSVPIPIYKGIGGAIGDGRAQKLLGVVGSPLVFHGRQQAHSHQASSHEFDMRSMSWLGMLAAKLHKLNLDIRLMVADADLVSTSKDVGSTAMPHKMPNPWRFERACGLLQSISKQFSVVCDAAANCALERTLTDQSILNLTFKRVYADMAHALVDTVEGASTFRPASRAFGPLVNSDVELVALVMAGVRREDAQKRLMSNRE